MCLTKAQQRRLDGFQNRCLRQIVGIKPSYISRVSNAAALEKSGHVAATKQLQKRQLQLFGKILRSSEDNPLKSVSFIPGTLRPETDHYVQRRGRPNKEWIPENLQLAIQIAKGTTNMQQAALSEQAWKKMLSNHFGF